ncbi:MAG TPA: hypothetical protein VEQ37_14620 [Actinomycetota bacterium]|nr:hypothetical protein [Actinomycetota bacterium]
MSSHLDELGEELRQLLRQKADAASASRLDLPLGVRRARRRLARNAIAWALALALLAYGAVSAASSLYLAPKPATSPTPPSKQVVATIPIDANPIGIAVGEGAVWVVHAAQASPPLERGQAAQEPVRGELSRIDPATNQVIQRIEVGGDPIDVITAFGAVWVIDRGEPRIVRVDPGTGALTPIPLPTPTEAAAAADGSIWASAIDDERVFRIDPVTGDVLAGVTVGYRDYKYVLAVGNQLLVGMGDSHRLVRIDASTNQVVASVDVLSTGGPSVASFAAADGAIWGATCIPEPSPPPPPDVKTSSPCTWEVVRIDPTSGEAVASITVGQEEPEYPPLAGHTSTELGSIAAGDGSVWVTAGDVITDADGSSVERGRIVQIDPATNKVVSSTEAGGSSIAVGQGGVWVLSGGLTGAVVVRIEE